jgi:hypothetical protein
MWRPVQNDLAFIASREGCVLTTYQDAHSPANGFGINDPSLKEGEVTTMEAAISRFVAHCEADALRIQKLFLPGIELSQTQFGALLSLTYNIGPGGAYKDRPGGGLAYQTDLLAAVDSYIGYKGDSRTERNRLRDWAGFEIVRINLDPVKGPFNLSRRTRESTLFTAGDYGDVSTLKYWGPGKSPRNTPPDPWQNIPMPQFFEVLGGA